MSADNNLKFKDVDWEKVAKIFTSEKTKKKGKIPTKEILYFLAAGGAIATAFLAPNALSLFKPFLKGYSEYEPGRIKQQLSRLKEKKMVEITMEDGQEVVKITQNGMVRALRYKLGEMKISEPRKWDRKWRIIVFDIPENSKWARDYFRKLITNLGFYLLQKSVFVYPYSCFDEIEYLRQICGAGVNVSYIVAEKIEGEEKLLNYFNLVSSH